MKLTAEQKQLFHECVDLALEVTLNTRHSVDISMGSFNVNELINSKRKVETCCYNLFIKVDFNEGIPMFEPNGAVFLFSIIDNSSDISDLQQAKDYLTELLVGKATLIKAFDRCLSNEECVELTK